MIDTPRFHGDPAVHGTNSEVYIIINFQKGLVLIGGTSYAGEIKKSIFTVMNYLLPFRRVLPMHCSANVGKDGDVALFFGLSGTGKTTLSADPTRGLIGDDEHGWSEAGVFNCEGGCYAKVIQLSQSAEPEIYATTHRFGTILENVVFDPVTRLIDLDDASITEITRASYTLEFIGNALSEKRAGHPKNISFLTCDASGVMPPIAKLSIDQARYQFISGFTSKIAGTEGTILLGKSTQFACRDKEALMHLEMAVRMEPFPPGVYHMHIGSAHFNLRNYEEAVSALKKAIAITPRNEFARACLMVAYVEMGRMEEAKTELQEYRKTNPKPLPPELYEKRSPWKDPKVTERWIEAWRKLSS